MNPDHPVDVRVKPGGGLHVQGYPTAVHLGRLSSPAAHKLRQREVHSATLRKLNASLQLLGNLLNGGFELPPEWPKSDVVDALWTATVVGYCRCFDPTQQEDRLIPEQVFGGKQDGLQVHQEIWKLRREHYAHDINDLRDVRVGVALDADGQNLDIIRLGATWYHGIEQLQNLVNLVADAKAFVERDIAELIRVLVQEVAAMGPPERLALPSLEFGPPKGEPRRQPRRGRG